MLGPTLQGRWGAMDSLPLAVEVPRSGEILHPFAMRCTQGVYALNVSRGCAHRCAYCYARAYRDAPRRPRSRSTPTYQPSSGRSWTAPGAGRPSPGW